MGHIIAINLPLLVWLSPSFPVGAFAYSHGLEWAQECGAVTRYDDLHAWLKHLIEDGSLKSDMAIVKATMAGQEVNDLALALAPSSERLLETKQQGNAFVKIIKTSWPHEGFTPPAGDVAYPVALALASKAYGFELHVVLTHFGLAFITNLTSASIRLGIIGQTEGQKLLNALLPTIKSAVEVALTTSLENSGTCCFFSDFVSLKHETQFTRIFRS